MSGAGQPGMTLLIKPGNEKPITLTGIDKNDTIGDLKKKIEEKEGIPPGQQQLGFVGNPLDNDKKRVRDYGIPNESTLDLSVGIPLNLNVKPPKGKTIPIKADSNDTVGDVKKKIEDKAGIPSKQQRLALGGDPLEGDDKCLSDFDIPNGSTLDLTIGMPMKIFIEPLTSGKGKGKGRGNKGKGNSKRLSGGGGGGNDKNKGKGKDKDGKDKDRDKEKGFSLKVNSNDDIGSIKHKIDVKYKIDNKVGISGKKQRLSHEDTLN